MSKQSVLVELLQLARTEKKYWLVPMLLFFAILGILIVFSQSSAIAPFIYTLF